MLDSLERRLLMSHATPETVGAPLPNQAAESVLLDRGVLKIKGGDDPVAGNTVTVRVSTDRRNIVVAAQFGATTKVESFAVKLVRRVVYQGGAGPDRVLVGGRLNDDPATPDVDESTLPPEQPLGPALFGNPGLFLDSARFTLRSQVFGLAGADHLFAGRGGDKLYGGDDNDVLYGQGAADVLVGGKGNDTLEGGTHADRIYAGEGADEVNLRQGSQAADVIFCGHTLVVPVPEGGEEEENGSGGAAHRPRASAEDGARDVVEFANGQRVREVGTNDVITDLIP